MHQRSKISPHTLREVSEELAGLPVSDSLAQIHAEAIESLMQGVDALRKLPLKNIVPPLTFTPEEDVR